MTRALFLLFFLLGSVPLATLPGIAQPGSTAGDTLSDSGTALRWTPPEGSFLQDSIRLGEPIRFAMSVRHPLNTMVLFPDSLYNFRPFEYLSQTWFPTRSDSLGSLDSVVYTLTTFEIDSVQSLRLPVWYLQGDDSVAVYTRRVEVDFKPTVVPPLPDSIALQATTDFAPVPTQFNYPYWSLGIATALLIGFFLFLLFGQPLRRRYQLYRLQRRHEAFERQFNQQLAYWKAQPTSQHSEALLSLWKQHLHLLSPHPFSSYTTRDITLLLPDPALNQTLHTLDRHIYGGLPPQPDEQLFKPLTDQVTRLYTQRREEVLHD
ncbi:hypothetical protein SAMN05421823_104265 [Catalinimonas alkaloidigena]|uniref:Oxygen tolerance n=1 Tax=Catalinimonas alkaloidigena TaxID=1075417 RepID=A0A1G9GZ67_9BACT|nr:hypothetical protein [Catalinimonas alkaloidigena]SDL05957.1 hypothetical protein SAMN05421823_104265 [Catalinimonas alkaloidigena]